MTRRPSVQDIAVVLVPGAWEGAAVWDGVAAKLAGRVRAVRAVELPYTSYAADLARVRHEMNTLGGPLVLVGHSSGGAVISSAAAGDDRVRGVVLVAAYAPFEGESIASLSAQGPAAPGADALCFGADGWTSLHPARFADALGADLPGETTAAMASALRPTHADCVTTPSGPVQWRDRPVSAVIATDDRILHPDLQRWMAQRVGAAITELPASHLVPVSRATEVAAAVLEHVQARS